MHQTKLSISNKIRTISKSPTPLIVNKQALSLFFHI